MSRWFVALALVVSLVALGCKRHEKLPLLGQVPAFQLTDHRGQACTAADLQGHVWAANFIFTSCPDICPLLTEKMVLLRSKTLTEAKTPRFVSFSVDPDTDIPEVLAEYAKKHHAEHPDWYFLTGPVKEVKRVIVEGFKQAMTEQPPKDGKANVLHGTHFVLVDQRGRMRGFYESNEPGLVALALAAGRLEDEEP